MVILGLNAFHADAAACLLVDGELVMAVEEERLRRVKHWAGFPNASISNCLRSTGLQISDIDHIAINRDPRANFYRKVRFGFSNWRKMGGVFGKLNNARRADRIGDLMCSLDGFDSSGFKARLHNVEHHRAHLASAFLVSPFEEAAVASIDGFGDYVSTMWARGRGSRIDVFDQVYIPHSLGIFYLAMTQFLGFMKYGDEYKVMGLAAYGRLTRLREMERIVSLVPRGKFELKLEYFRHHTLGVEMNWCNGEPEIGQLFTPALERLLGPARRADEPLTEHHYDIAASAQAAYETAFFHVINELYERVGSPRLCLAGGCAMNSVANGKVFERSKFKELYVQPAAGDAGGAIGAALSVWHETMGEPRQRQMVHANLGPSFCEDDIAPLIARHLEALREQGCRVEQAENVDWLCRRTIAVIAQGGVVGWFQGRMEWGPRALGNRSILCDPRRADMKDILNLKIKRRESFRPFAPAILREAVSEWFETDYDVPFMTQVYKIRKDKRALIPAVTHVDGTGRLQTVDLEANPLFHRLITLFAEETGVPILLNTSFNENEPIVCAPEEALDCFLRTKMDMLILGKTMVRRSP